MVPGWNHVAGLERHIPHSITRERLQASPPADHDEALGAGEVHVR
jgi:hypothetical protein